MPDDRFATIYVLCYGDYLDLHRRVLDSLAAALPADETTIVVWGNELSDRCRQYIDEIGNKLGDFRFHAHDGNLPKYHVMRKLWHEESVAKPRTPWILWLDDDTYIEQPKDWWRKTREYIRIKQYENACYIGKPYYVHYLAGQEQFIKEAPWYTGQPWEMLPTRNRRVLKPGITFATGSYVWLRTDTMQQLNWPDIRLSHNGGDTLLGEAIRQQGLPFHKFHYGVAVNKAKRRGRSERPAGSKVDIRR